MKRFVYSNNDQSVSDFISYSQRGAVTFGTPVSPAVDSYINDVSPKAEKERIISMFFCGSPFSCLNYFDLASPDYVGEDQI